MNNKRNVKLLTIDPQNDFCNPKGSLFVAGADQDAQRLAEFINGNRNRLDDIHCTLDCHQSVHIAHPIFWVNSKGEHPTPFTVITASDVRNGVWRCFNPKWQPRAQGYVDSLEKNQRYELRIWPPHCIIGTWGQSVVPAVSDALIAWEVNGYNRVKFVAKGSNFFTEHYSGVQADVEDNTDPSTKLNTRFIDDMTEADEILITGEALSHCVANTVQDIANQFGIDNIKKFTLLKDTSSNVGGCEKLGNDFVLKMSAQGMRVTTTNAW